MFLSLLLILSKQALNSSRTLQLPGHVLLIAQLFLLQKETFSESLWKWSRQLSDRHVLHHHTLDNEKNRY